MCKARRFLTPVLIAFLVFALPLKTRAYALCDGNTIQNEKQTHETHCDKKLPDAPPNAHTCSDCLACVNFIVVETNILMKNFSPDTPDFAESRAPLYDLIYFSEKPPKRVDSIFSI